MRAGEWDASPGAPAAGFELPEGPSAGGEASLAFAPRGSPPVGTGPGLSTGGLARLLEGMDCEADRGGQPLEADVETHDDCQLVVPESDGGEQPRGLPVVQPPTAGRRVQTAPSAPEDLYNVTNYERALAASQNRAQPLLRLPWESGFLGVVLGGMGLQEAFDPPPMPFVVPTVAPAARGDHRGAGL